MRVTRSLVERVNVIGESGETRQIAIYQIWHLDRFGSRTPGLKEAFDERGIPVTMAGNMTFHNPHSGETLTRI